MSMPLPINKRWTYEESGGLVHPVLPGEVWRVGPDHVYACLDFMSEHGHRIVRGLLTEHRPTLLYSDPPWGQGLINQFRTKAGLERADYRWEALYRRIVGYVPQDFPIWLESGKRERAKILTEVLHAHRNVAVFDVRYYQRNPSLSYYAGPVPAPCNPTGLDDAEIPGFVMRHYPVGRVFDPCAGRGGTAASAARLGWASLSVELSPYRMSAGLCAIADVLGAVPERVSEAS